MRRKKAIQLLFLVSMLWGGGYIGVDVTVDAFTTFPLLATRFLFASLILYVFFKDSIDLNYRNVSKFGMFGVFLFLGFVFQTFGLTQTTVANNAFFTSLSVVIVPYLAWIVKKDKPKKTDLIASVLALLAISVLIFNKEKLKFTLNKGDIITLLGTISFSIQIILVSMEKEASPLTISFIQMSVAGLLALILSIITKSRPQFIDVKALVGISYLIVFATLLPYVIQNHAIRYVNTNMASVILSTESLFATIFSVIILNEPFQIKTFVSLAIMIFAVYISSKGNEKNEKN